MAVIRDNIITFSGAIQHRRGSADTLSVSDYVPLAGELLVATDTGDIRVGDGVHTWAELPAYDETTINNNLETQVAGTALDAAQGYAINQRLLSVEGVTSIDCGEITLASNGD